MKEKALTIDFPGATPLFGSIVWVALKELYIGETFFTIYIYVYIYIYMGDSQNYGPFLGYPKY